MRSLPERPRTGRRSLAPGAEALVLRGVLEWKGTTRHVDDPLLFIACFERRTRGWATKVPDDFPPQ